jgi:phosphohistidine phosphatase
MSMDARLEAVPNAEIDEGVFKYILIRVYGKEDEQGNEISKLIVR